MVHAKAQRAPSFFFVFLAALREIFPPASSNSRRHLCQHLGDVLLDSLEVRLDLR
jgi:hypothetical protein